jgi:hypothetical protein
MAFPLFSMLLLILLGRLALLFDGVARIIQDMRGQGISRQHRALLVGVGVLSIVISGIIIAHAIGFGVPLLAVLMTPLLIVGIVMIAMGTTGERIVVGKMPIFR